MIASDFFIDPASWEADEAALRSLRIAIFVDELGVPLESAFDQQEARARHVLARALDGQAIGCGRVTSLGRISRVAVLPAWRSKGVGSALMRSLIDTARERGLSKLTLSAQRDAVAFYLALGFECEGAPFEEAGIAHQNMQILLPLPAPLVRVGTQALLRDLPDAELVGSKTSSQLLEVSVRLLHLAQTSLTIYTRDLDPAIYDQQAFLEPLRQLALRRGARIRILVHNCHRAVQDGHRMVELSRRLPSAFAFKQPQAEDLQYTGAFLLNDRLGHVLRSFGDRFESEGNLRDPGPFNSLKRYFDEVWERSGPAEELRRLSM